MLLNKKLLFSISNLNFSKFDSKFGAKFKNSLLFLLLFSCIFLTTGCLATYLIKSGYEHLSILDARKPIEEVITDKKLDPKVKNKLLLSLEARKFTTKKLGLKETDSYTTFVDLKRPYVTYIVYAAKKMELKNHFFSYPLVGDLPYKGFFTKEEAEEEAKTLSPDEYDVIVQGVSAYSTLGWFSDPILSTMLYGDDFDFVNLIIHESTHATVYFKSQADFNERLATFVGNKGTEMFYLEKEGENSETLKKIKDEAYDINIFSEFISSQVKDLSAFYENLNKESATLAEKLTKRESQMAMITDNFVKNVKPRLKTGRYVNFGKKNLNNALILYYRTYVYDLKDFETMYDLKNKNMNTFISYCKSLEQNSNPEMQLKLDLSSAH
jgi:predicted aminopeptidase